MQESFWPERKKSTFSLFGGKAGAGALETSGIVGLDRMLRANKLTPDIITDYAKIVLTNRLEILLGVEKDQEQYDQIKQKYAQTNINVHLSILTPLVLYNKFCIQLSYFVKLNNRESIQPSLKLM